MVISGHVTKMAVTPFDPPYLKTPRYTQTSWLCVFVEPKLLPMEVLHCGIGIFDLYASCDLELHR